MRNVSAFQPVPYQNQIAFDNATNGGVVNPATSLTFSHTCSGSNRILFVGCAGDVTNDTITGVTYGGVAMTLVSKSLVPTDRYTYLWYLINPSSGANNVIITSSGNLFISGYASSYTGARQTTQPDASGTNTGSGVTSLTGTVTVISPGSWMVGFAKFNSTVGAGAGTTLRIGDGAGQAIFDSNGLRNKGSSSLNITNGTSSNVAFDFCSFAPVGSSTKAYYPLNGNLAGSLKDSAVAYWKLDESSGNAVDSIASVSATNTSVTYAASKINNGGVFNGSAVLTTSTGYSLSTSTLSTWIKTGSASSMGLVAFPNSSGNTGTQNVFATSAGKIRYGGGTIIESPLTYNDNAWHHVVVVSTGTTATMYVDGASVVSGTIDNLSFTCYPRFGCFAGGGGNQSFFTGSLDEVGIWNRALTSDEVSRLYNAGNGQQLETRALDYSGNGNHGTETAVTYTQGRFGQGAKFNGTTSIISRDGNSPAGVIYAQFGSAFTMGCWINESTLAANKVFLGMQVQSGSNQRRNMFLNSNTGNIRVNIFDGASNNYTSSMTIRPNAWYQILLTYDGSTIKVYGNGTLILNQSRALSAQADAQTGGFGIGAERQNGLSSNYFTGLVDEVIIESRAWTAKEVETYYRKSMLNYRTSFFGAIFSYILSVSKATFTVTPTNITFKQALKVSKAEVSITTKVVSLIFRGWTNLVKSVSTWTNGSKNSSTWTNESKNSSIWTDEPKS